jgi:hypothetical protein
MTTPIAHTAPANALAAWPEQRHEHDMTCYWDLHQCRWSCYPPTAGLCPPPEREAQPFATLR